MISRLKFFNNSSCLKLTRRLVSNEFKEVLDTRLTSSDYKANITQLSTIQKNMNAVNLDLFVNSLGQYEDNVSVLDLLSNFRSSKLTNSTLESTNFAVVGYLLDHSNSQELITVLLDRLQYGVFLNNFTAFAVLSRLHEEKEYTAALPLTLKIVLQDELEGLFISAFTARSCYTHLKEGIWKNVPCEDTTEKQPVQEIKVRVKYIRNITEVTVDDKLKEMGKALLKICDKLSGDVRCNMKILGLLLTKRYDELTKVFSSELENFYQDVYKICLDVLQHQSQSELITEFGKSFEKKGQTQSFEEVLDILLSESAKSEEGKLIEDQKNLFPKWIEDRDNKKRAIEAELSQMERQENIEKVMDDISKKQEQLWFFELEDKLDLEIYKKRTSYPKRWFGKKKKPRVVDEHYVPPHVRKIN